MILTLKTDTPTVTIGLHSATTHEKKHDKTWEVGRELSVEILPTIEALCEEDGILMSGITGVIVYEGPGSYTGLRIAISVANAIGSSYKIPVIGSSGETWLQDGFIHLASAIEFKQIAPVYGGEVYTTKPRK